MNPSLDRRQFVRAVAAASALALVPRALAQTSAGAPSQFAELEKKSGVRLGVFALDMGTGAQVSHRADERFPLCSTFKVLLVGAILNLKTPGLLDRRIRYTRANLVTYSPVTEKHLADGLTVGELCAAALQYSDNTAANLLMRLLSGPKMVTAFARTLGDEQFRLDRWETRLNSARPGDARDTATPRSMAQNLQQLVLGEALPAPESQQLTEWMRGNTTGDKRIRAGVPPHWQVGDKTGSGDYGTANDIGVLFRPDRDPLVLAIYSTQTRADAKWSDALIAQATRIVVSSLTA